mgnify:CR=1 FL=1
MANESGVGTVWSCPNFVGQLITLGAYQTPFLNDIGGIQGGGKVVQSEEYALNQQFSLESASQPAITETASLTAPTAITYVRTQDVNTTQIFQKAVNISYRKLSNAQALEASSIAVTGQLQPVQDERTTQINAVIKQIAWDVDYTFLNGVYQKATNAATAAKTRGMFAAISTNAVAAGTTALSASLINQLAKKIVDSGSPLGRMVCYVNSFQKQALSAIYGYAPEDRRTGGVNIERIETDFFVMEVRFAPNVPAANLLIADISVCAPVFSPVPSKGVFFYEELAKVGAAEQGQIYGQIGLDYVAEEFHGEITGLTTS